MQTKLQLIRRFQQHVKNVPVYTAKIQRNDVENLVAVFFFLTYVSGIVVAKSFLSTLVAIFFPPWALYLVVEKFLISNKKGII